MSLFLLIFLLSTEVRVTLSQSLPACTSGQRPTLLNAKNGVFQSEGYPGNYPDEANCQWLIDASPQGAETVRIDFTDLYTEECCDKICFKDGPTLQSPQISCHAGFITPSTGVFSTGQQIYAHFVSDIDTNYRGFKISYNTDPGCRNGNGVVLTDRTGIIESTHHPGQYANDETCTWNIQAPGTADTIILEFTTFTLQSSGTCTADYVEVWDGGSLIGRWCGSNKPPDWQSTTNDVTVVFRTDSSVKASGFAANYSMDFLEYTTTEPELTTVETTAAAATVPTTGPTLAPINEELFLYLPLNGTATSGSTLSEECLNQYAEVISIRAVNMMFTINDRITNSQMCLSASLLYLDRSDTQILSANQDVLVKVNYYMPNIRYKVSVGNHQACLTEIANFSSSHSNWEQPLLPQQDGCPLIVFNPQIFDHFQKRWQIEYDLC